MEMVDFIPISSFVNILQLDLQPFQSLDRADLIQSRFTKLLKAFQGRGGVTPMLHIAFPLMFLTSTESMLMFIDRLYLKQVSAEAMNTCLSDGFSSFAFVFFSSALLASVSLGDPIFWDRTAPKMSQVTHSKHFI